MGSESLNHTNPVPNRVSGHCKPWKGEGRGRGRSAGEKGLGWGWGRGRRERGHGSMLSCGQGYPEPRAPHEKVQGAREGRRNLILPEIDMTTVRRRLINSG